MTMRDHDALDRVAALVQSDQARILADESELRRLAAQIESVPALPESRPRRRWLLLPALVVPAMAVALVVAGWPRVLSYQAAGVVSQAGVKLSTDGVQSLPLRFSDGSVLTLAPGSRAEVVELSARGANVRLASGVLSAAVVHANRTRWAVAAGPYVVNVKGTRFTTAWDQRRQRLRVALTEGSVVVEGPMLGATGLPLARGQALTVDVEEQKVSLSPMVERKPTAPAADTSSPPEGSVTEAALEVPSDDGAGLVREPLTPALVVDPWKRWALASRPREALAAATRVGFDRLCGVLPAPDLLLLADAARFANDPSAAAKAFTALRERFPDDVRAGDAVFALGVLALDAEGRPTEASTRFEEYLDLWPTGPLAREAHGRLIEALDRAYRREDAARVAARYLEHFADGPHADLARRLLTTKP
jgi:hypothetical protein